MNGKEFCEKTAKIMGLVNYKWVDIWGCMAKEKLNGGYDPKNTWDPLYDPRDGIDLAEKLELTVKFSERGVSINGYPPEVSFGRALMRYVERLEE